MVKYDVTLSDPLLEPFKPVIRRRQEKSLLKELEFTGRERRLSDVFNNHLYFGLHETAEGWVFREWAPNATAIYLVERLAKARGFPVEVVGQWGVGIEIAEGEDVAWDVV